MVRREQARWTSPRVVRVEGWRPASPPLHGPAIAAARRQVAVAWYTEAGGVAQLVAAFSADAGRTFAPPTGVDRANDKTRPTGAVDVAVDDDGSALLLWTTRPAKAAPSGPRATLWLCRCNADGRCTEPIRLATGVHDDVGQTPRLARARERLAIAWADGSPPRLRARTLPLATITIPENGKADVVADATPDVDGDSGRGRAGDLLPAIEMKTLRGDDLVSIASLQGRPVLLNLWAKWCAPCIAEIPELLVLRERYAAEGLAVVGVSMDGAADVDRVSRFVAQHTMPYDIWLDPEMSLYSALRARGLPVTLVIDRERAHPLPPRPYDQSRRSGAPRSAVARLDGLSPRDRVWPFEDGSRCPKRKLRRDRSRGLIMIRASSGRYVST